MIIKLVTILLPILYALILWRYSVWQLCRELDKRSAPLREPRLDAVIGQLAHTLALPAIPVHLYEEAQLNGLAAPDGRIFLTRGMIEAFRADQISPAEIASVIAHELGHVALGHTRQRMIDFTGHSVMRLAFASVLGRILPGIGAHLAGFLSKLLAARLSRRDEYAADAWATALLIKAGIGASGQKSLLAKLEQQSAQRDGPAAWLMSHPGAGQRIAAIEANERRWCPGEPGEPTV